jgi:hypothetical protein
MGARTGSANHQPGGRAQSTMRMGYWHCRGGGRGARARARAFHTFDAQVRRGGFRSRADRRRQFRGRLEHISVQPPHTRGDAAALHLSRAFRVRGPFRESEPVARAPQPLTPTLSPREAGRGGRKLHRHLRPRTRRPSGAAILGRPLPVMSFFASFSAMPNNSSRRFISFHTSAGRTPDATHTTARL